VYNLFSGVILSTNLAQTRLKRTPAPSHPDISIVPAILGMPWYNLKSNVSKPWNGNFSCSSGTGGTSAEPELVAEFVTDRPTAAARLLLRFILPVLPLADLRSDLTSSLTEEPPELAGLGAGLFPDFLISEWGRFTTLTPPEHLADWDEFGIFC
jgi:hypothetical protein